MTPSARPILTCALEAPPDLLGTPWRDTPTVAWVRNGEGMVGFGVAAIASFRGAERFSRAQRWVTQWLAQCRIDDTSGQPGAGPVAFASFSFDDLSADSVVVVPRTLIAVRRGRAWRTDVFRSAGEADSAAPGVSDLIGPDRRGPQPEPVWDDDTAGEAGWRASVGEAVKRIAAGELDKVVLAREVRARFSDPVPVTDVLRRLALRYPECWTFHIDGLMGATPELLVRRSRDLVTSRVLAGSVASTDSPHRDSASAQELRASSKNLSEHEYAVRSVAHALAIHCTDLDIPQIPTVLRLANVQHLATDITGNLADGATALALAASLHPTAAVCGTPTERARGVISELEVMDRGRYSGPVGWFDANGDGEFAIALRCAQLSPDRRSARLFAGCGLVADSDSGAELAESNVKLDAMRWALSSDG